MFFVSFLHMEPKEKLTNDHKIIKLLLEKSPLTASEIMKESKIAKPTAYRRLKALKQVKIVKKIKNKYAISTYNPLEERVEKALKEKCKLIYPDHIESFEEAIKQGHKFFRLSEGQFKEIAVYVGKPPNDKEFLEAFQQVLDKYNGIISLDFTPPIKL